MTGCVIAPPPSPMAANDPSNSQAPEASSPRLRPALVATTKKYLSVSAGADAQAMGAMNMSGLDHGAMGGMKMPMPETVAAPSGEQLQNKHPSSYTCRMHPEVKSDKPGKCPKCGMTLVSQETVEKQKQPKPQP